MTTPSQRMISMIIHHAEDISPIQSGGFAFDKRGKARYDLLKQEQQRNEGNMTHDGKAFLPGATGRLSPILGGTIKPSVYVADLLTIFPELAAEGERDSEFAHKVLMAAELARREDAYEDLRGRVKSEPERVDLQVNLGPESLATIKRFQERADASRDNGIDPDCGA